MQIGTVANSTVEKTIDHRKKKKKTVTEQANQKCMDVALFIACCVC
jgi:CRISPR/Cas system type I-B associated protein Csh2 (Cas7 group RAMP superfamily)